MLMKVVNDIEHWQCHSGYRNITKVSKDTWLDIWEKKEVLSILSVLVWARIELLFFLVGDRVLCLEFRLRIMLIPC